MSTSLSRVAALIALAGLPLGSALADVWKWVDPLGETHFVDTLKPIFTWVDDDGKVTFSDTPDHEDAIAVQLVWHSRGSLADFDPESPESESEALAEETPAEREARLQAQAEYCQRVTEIHDSYVNAPRLYRTNEKGEREFLSKTQKRRAIREIASAKKDACRQNRGG